MHLPINVNVTSESPPRYNLEYIPGIMVLTDFAHIPQVYFIGTEERRPVAPFTLY